MGNPGFLHGGSTASQRRVAETFYPPAQLRRALHGSLVEETREGSSIGRSSGFRIVLAATLPAGPNLSDLQWLCSGSSPVTEATTATDSHRLPFSRPRSPRNWAHRKEPSNYF